MKKSFETPGDADPLQFWREKLFFFIFLSTAITAIFPYIITILHVVQFKLWTNMIVYSVFYLVCLLILLFRKQSFTLRAALGILSFYSLGLLAFLTVGPLGSGRIWLLSVSILATLLLGARAGLITLGTNVLAIVGAGLLYSANPIGVPADLEIIQGWRITGVTFVFLNAITTIGAAILIKALEVNLDRQKELTEELEVTNQKLRKDYAMRLSIEAELLVSRAILEQAIEGNPIPTYVIDQDRKITHWNRACSSLSGFTATEMLGTGNHFRILFENPEPMLADLVLDRAEGKDSTPLENREVRPSSLIEQGLEGEFIQSRKNQEEKSFLRTAAPLRDGQGNIMGAIETVMDISYLKNIEKQLFQAMKMESVGRLAGGVAHDYNNISSIIIGYAEMALARQEPGSELHEDLSEILSAALRSTEITKQLLAFARKQTIKPRIMNINTRMPEILKMLDRLVGEDIQLSWTPGKSLMNVKMDPAQIDQILVNLCVNARDAISDVGKITVETANVEFGEEYCSRHVDFIPGRYVMIAVSDDGAGIDQSQIDQIFDPFYTTKKESGGSGLGLATIHGIVKQNNGFIHVYSEPEKGTTFRIYLNSNQEKTEKIRTEKAGSDPTRNNETILLVEDDRKLLTLEEKMLRDLGFKVLPCAAPEAALAQARSYTPQIDLLLTDVILPGMNGKTLAAKIQKLLPDIEILYMSGYTANVIAHRGILDEGINFISKPFNKASLAAKIRLTLDGD